MVERTGRERGKDAADRSGGGGRVAGSLRAPNQRRCVPTTSGAERTPAAGYATSEIRTGASNAPEPLLLKTSALGRADGTVLSSRGQAAPRRAAPGDECEVMGPLKEGGWFVRVTTEALSTQGSMARSAVSFVG